METADIALWGIPRDRTVALVCDVHDALPILLVPTSLEAAGPGLIYREHSSDGPAMSKKDTRDADGPVKNQTNDMPIAKS